MAKRRRRKTSLAKLARPIIEAKQSKRNFLREVSAILSDALGFSVKVSLAKPGNVPADATPAMRKAARMSRPAARRQMADSMHAPLAPKPGTKRGIPGLDDDLGGM